MFIDELTITIRSGAGGRGCESFRRRQDHKRVPDGGDGGNGGDVVLRADSQTGSLFPLKSKRVFEAESGGFGQGNNRYGRNGSDIVVNVPCGTTLYNKRDELLVRDLTRPGDEVIVLKGGKGGRGNHGGGTPTHGEPAKELELLLSLKIIADIVLVGLPNSGKTLLLKHLTRAGVKEADYPFATKSPQLGTYRTDASELGVCDLPSIYESSAQGRGLGTHYLKHLERARLIFLVVEPESKFASDLISAYQVLLETLRRFNDAFLAIPRFFVVNKIDAMPGKRIDQKLLPKDVTSFLVSASDGTGIARLMKAAQQALEIRHGTAA